MEVVKDTLFQIAMNSVPIYALNEFGFLDKVVNATDNVLPRQVAESFGAAVLANSSKYVSRVLYDAGIFSVAPWYSVPEDASSLATLLAFDSLGYYALSMAGARDRLDEIVPIQGEVADAVKMSTIVSVNDLIMSALQKTGLVSKAYSGLETQMKRVF